MSLCYSPLLFRCKQFALSHLFVYVGQQPVTALGDVEEIAEKIVSFCHGVRKMRIEELVNAVRHSSVKLLPHSICFYLCIR